MMSVSAANLRWLYILLMKGRVPVKGGPGDSGQETNNPTKLFIAKRPAGRCARSDVPSRPPQSNIDRNWVLLDAEQPALVSRGGDRLIQTGLRVESRRMRSLLLGGLKRQKAQLFAIAGSRVNQAGNIP